jgi:hypothetical protein
MTILIAQDNLKVKSADLTTLIIKVRKPMLIMNLGPHRQINFCFIFDQFHFDRSNFTVKSCSNGQDLKFYRLGFFFAPINKSIIRVQY